ncbi:MAG: hypothetical protein ACLGH5_04260 [Actinomycetes bacterium]
MANRQDRRRNATRARKKVAVSLEVYERPADGCEEMRIPVPMPHPRFRITQRLVSYRHQLVEFAVILSEWDGRGWEEVYSVDTCHGYLHEHIHGHRKPNDRRDIKPLFTQVDVQESLDFAYDKVRDHYLKLTG